MLKILKSCKKGFTLLELLVVVLIIGILASIALPQYQLSVEKAKSAEVLMNIATIKREIGLYITAKGLPSEDIHYEDFANVQLSGGEWEDEGYLYVTQNFSYGIAISSNGGYAEISRDSDNRYYTLYCSQYEQEEYYNDDSPMGDGWYCTCVTQDTDLGRKMCKSVYEPLGFKYADGAL